MADFSNSGERPFALGVIRGERAFCVARDGILTGVMAQLPWVPGENLAQCATHYSVRVQIQLMGIKQTTGRDVMERLFPRGHCPRSQGRTATRQCSCGFYAYYNHKQQYDQESDRITGIIEGYGTVTYGVHGFRSEKAKIVALVNPNASKYGWLWSWIPRQIWPGLLPYCVIVLLNNVLGAWTHVYSKDIYEWISIIVMGIYLAFLGFVLAGTMVRRKHRKSHGNFALSDNKWRKVMKQYPDVEVFKSMAEAQEKYPLTEYRSLP